MFRKTYIIIKDPNASELRTFKVKIMAEAEAYGQMVVKCTPNEAEHLQEAGFKIYPDIKFKLPEINRNLYESNNLSSYPQANPTGEPTYETIHNTTTKMDLEAFKTIFTDSQFKPDMIKIYPTLVVKGTKLFNWWRKGEYSPLNTEETIELISKVKEEKKLKPSKEEQVELGREVEEKLKALEEKAAGKVAAAPVPTVAEKEVEQAPPVTAETVEAVKTVAEEEIELAEKKVEIAAYNNIKIYKIPGKPMLYYFVPVPRPTVTERTIINTLKEAATRLITIAPYKIRDPEQRRAVSGDRCVRPR